MNLADHNSYVVLNFLQFPAVFVFFFFKTTSPIYTELDTKLFLMKCGAFNGRTREIEKTVSSQKVHVVDINWCQ